MARKHFDKYFNQISSQYAQLSDVLADMSAEVENGMMEPERLTQLKATIEPVKNSYETLNYIRYLLDMPVRASKQLSYNRRSKKVMGTFGDNTADRVLDRNSRVLKGLQNK